MHFLNWICPSAFLLIFLYFILFIFALCNERAWQKTTYNTWLYMECTVCMDEQCHLLRNMRSSTIHNGKSIERKTCSKINGKNGWIVRLKKCRGWRFFNALKAVENKILPSNCSNHFRNFYFTCCFFNDAASRWDWSQIVERASRNELEGILVEACLPQKDEMALRMTGFEAKVCKWDIWNINQGCQ
jgi:hypothetical protein